MGEDYETIWVKDNILVIGLKIGELSIAIGFLIVSDNSMRVRYSTTCICRAFIYPMCCMVLEYLLYWSTSTQKHFFTLDGNGGVLFHRRISPNVLIKPLHENQPPRASSNIFLHPPCPLLEHCSRSGILLVL